MFSRQTITKDPISVTPTVFDIVVLLGWYSTPVAINITGNEALLDSTSWHVVESASITSSNPELLLIPWIAEATGAVLGNNSDLTDSLLLGDISINITLGIAGFTDVGSELAPSWYIRQPYKSEKGFSWNKFIHHDLKINSPHVDAPNLNKEIIDIPWGAFEHLFHENKGLWNFIPKIDKFSNSPFQDFTEWYTTDISQKYSSPELKDLEKIIPWDTFANKYSTDISQNYSYPDIKDLEKTLPWNTFGNPLDPIFGMDYSHPAIKDVFKTIFVGPNWFPRWCINQFTYSLGELTLTFLSDINQPYQQYFPTQSFPTNQQNRATLPNQLSIEPQPINRKSMFPSGHSFGRIPIAVGDSTLQLRGRTGGTLNIDKMGFLEYPIYMRNNSGDYAQVCFDGYRTGPQDAYDYKPVYYPVPIPNIRSYYIVMNTVSLKRVSDNTIIPIATIEIRTDLDSWGWSFQAELRRKVDLNLITPQGTPVEVEATINGNIWRFLVEGYGESVAFGRRAFTISGRSPSAMLAAPYTRPKSYIEPSTRQAVQLAEGAVLTTGYTIDWQLTDWLVPGNVYSVSDKTPMQELLSIAGAAGGVVQSAQAATTISLLPRYATLPWNWGGVVVDAILPTFSSRSTQFQPTPQYTGVYVSGQSQGVTAFVKRLGTAGSEQPQMVVDPLITEGAAGLQKASEILAGSGTRSIESIEAPLLDNPGLLKPGMLIEVIDAFDTWRGQVLSVSIQAQRPQVTQSLSILRYHGS